ncbi:MAG: endonuclease/exonuclease/phosphatase family protein [Candidatus Cloacimonetes bacterium]|nr:endonuclease/exonuclease/phosphatase family protein [Candidatus Cloacimonadota bacterium]
MKNIFVISIVSLLIVIGCGENNTYHPTPEDPSVDSVSYGTDGTFDIMTWNIENYPKSGHTTNSLIVDIITSLKVDLIALQEIESNSYFQLLLDSLLGWNGLRSTTAHGAEDLLVAYIYNMSTVSVQNSYEIFENDSYAFPRAPFIIECTWNGHSVVVINNHLKCCGNGIFDGDEWDEEKRRQAASESLQVFIEGTYPNDAVIVLGDLNDKINDPQSQNVFWNFIEDDLEYEFIDMGIAVGSNYWWSWGDGYSHIDHILVTSELFSHIQDVSSLRLQDAFDGGWNEYEGYISDHIPVATRIDFSQ